jgi:hypothetical protein
VLLILFFLISASACGAEPKRLAFIDFFGYGDLDPRSVHAALPFHEGDTFREDEASAWKQAATETVRRVTGRPATDVTTVCCTETGSVVVFIGLSGTSSKAPKYSQAPRGPTRLPAELMRLDAEVDQAWYEAVRRGNADEDRSQGYSLFNDPATRSKQLAVRRLALRHEKQIFDALATSGDRSHRAVAANVLGYARQTTAQVDALVRAASDPDAEVRNNAVRALGLLAEVRPALRTKIPTAVFVNLVWSGFWTDRNKGVHVLLTLADRRNPALLEVLRSEALEPLIEIARWRSVGHAYAARVLLGRIARIEDSKLEQLLTSGQVEAVVEAARAVNQR